MELHSDLHMELHVGLLAELHVQQIDSNMESIWASRRTQIVHISPRYHEIETATYIYGGVSLKGLVFRFPGGISLFRLIYSF